MGDQHRLTADDLFAGGGGWDVAADWLDIHARGVENMPEARATRDAAGLTTVHDDVWTFRPDGRASGLIASPPCQTFSTAGKGSGRKALDDVLALLPLVPHMTLAELQREGRAFGDDRTALVLTPLWFALHHPYRWLAWEQVPTVLPVWEACAKLLRSKGWSAWAGVLHAEQYGVPQTRKRAFLLASRDLEVTPPTPTHSRYHSRTPEKLDPGVAKWVSMAEGIGWGLLRQPAYAVTAGGGDGRSVWADQGVRNRLQELATSGDTDLWRLKGWGLTDRPAPTITGGGTETGGAEPIAKLARYTDRPDWLPRGYMSGAGSSSTIQTPRPVTEPAHTITGAGTAEWHDRPGPAADHGQRARDAIRLEPHEAGILQSFPTDYPWQGAKGKRFLQAGNAVPPLLAMAALSAALGEPYVPPNMQTITEPAQPALAFTE